MLVLNSAYIMEKAIVNISPATSNWPQLPVVGVRFINLLNIKRAHNYENQPQEFTGLGVRHLQILTFTYMCELKAWQ